MPSEQDRSLNKAKRQSWKLPRRSSSQGRDVDSPRNKPPKSGGSVAEPSKNGSRVGESRAVSLSHSSNRSSKQPSASIRPKASRKAGASALNAGRAPQPPVGPPVSNAPVRFDIPPGLYESYRYAALGRSVSAKELMHCALIEKLERLGQPSPKVPAAGEPPNPVESSQPNQSERSERLAQLIIHSPLDELDEAVQQTCALMELFEEALARSGDEENGVPNDDTLVGRLLLRNSTEDRLRNAAKAVSDRLIEVTRQNSVIALAKGGQQ